MGQYKYLAKNIALLTLSSFATKLLSFFLVPLYTNILSTTDYGTYDLFNTTIGVLLPVLTLNIQESVLRFSLDNKISRKSIVTVATKYFLVSNLIVAVGLGVNYAFDFSTMVKDYTAFFFLMYLTQSLSGMVMAYIRGIDNIMDLSVSSIVSSLATILCNILFLVGFKWGLIGYFLANIIGPLVQCLYLLFRGHVFSELDFRESYQDEKSEMLDYSKPMIANSLAWWVNNASDKYVVTWICGVAENGIYSVASKIPSILNIFQSIFAQAWTLSAVKDFDPEDKDGFFANTYAAYNCVMTIVCSAIIVGNKILASFLYAKDFYVAWRYVPWLTIAIVFGSLSGYIGGFFSAVKDSKIFATSTMIGAGANIVLNIIFTPLMGALGAAIATAVCYFITWALRFIQSRKIIRLKVKIFRDMASYVLLCVQAVALLFIGSNAVLYAVEGGLFMAIALLYIRDIGVVVKKVLAVVRAKLGK